MSPDLSLREFRYFIAVYQTRSFSAAARKLQMSQPPLSQAIATLERRLDVRLFERTSREVRPTLAADALFPEAEFIVRRAAETPALVSRLVREGNQRPLVRVGAVSSTFAAFLSALIPHMSSVSMTVSDFSSSQAIEELSAGRLDLALVRDSDLEAEQIVLVEEQLFVAVPEHHALADLDECRITDIANDPLIVFDRAMAPIAFDAIAACFRLSEVPMNPVAHVHSEQAALGLVAADLGVTFVPETLTSLPRNGVTFLRLRDSPVTYPLRALVEPGDPLHLLPLVRDTSQRALSDLRMPMSSEPSPPKEGNLPNGVHTLVIAG